MTTTTERLDRATFQHRWSDDLAAAHTEARDKWAEAAAESAGELRAFADFLHELDVPGLVAMADDLAAERLAETAEWPAWAELEPIEPSAIILLEGRRGAADTPSGAAWTSGFLTHPDPSARHRAGHPAKPLADNESSTPFPTEPDLDMGREIRAALSRPALIRGTYIPDKPAETAGEYMEQVDIEGEPWQQWLRRSLGDLWKQVWPR